MTVFTKVPNFPKNSDFRPFLSQTSRSENIFDALKPNDIASATLYLSYPTKVRSLSTSFSTMTNFGSS